MNELKNNYSGKRVLVTGHTGFKGSWLIKILSDLKAKKIFKNKNFLIVV